MSQNIKIKIPKTKPYSCECGKGFQTMFTLQRHQSSSCEHKGIRLFLIFWSEPNDAYFLHSNFGSSDSPHQRRQQWKWRHENILTALKQMYVIFIVLRCIDCGLKYLYSASWFWLSRIVVDSSYENENFTASRPSSLRKLSQSSSESGSIRCRSKSIVSKRKKIANHSPARSGDQVAAKKRCLCSYQDDEIRSNAADDTGEWGISFSLRRVHVQFFLLLFQNGSPRTRQNSLCNIIQTIVPQVDLITLYLRLFSSRWFRLQKVVKLGALCLKRVSWERLLLIKQRMRK